MLLSPTPDSVCVMLAVKMSEETLSYFRFLWACGCVCVCFLCTCSACVCVSEADDQAIPFALAAETHHGRSLLVYQERKEGRVKNNAVKCCSTEGKNESALCVWVCVCEQLHTVAHY